MQKQKRKATKHCINVMNIQEINVQKIRMEQYNLMVEFSILVRIRLFERFHQDNAQHFHDNHKGERKKDERPSFVPYLKLL